MSEIKIAATLYSLTSEYVTERRTLEGCLAGLHEMGYKGVEFIPAQMAPEYPYLSDEWLAWFRGLLEKYDLEPVCWSAYIDMGIRSDRDLTREEIEQQINGAYAQSIDTFRDIVDQAVKMADFFSQGLLAR